MGSVMHAASIKALLAGTVVVIAYWLVTAQLDARYEQGVGAGRLEGREACTAEREVWAATVVELEREAREVERLHASAVTNIIEANAEKLREIEHAKNADIADLRRGTLRLREGFRACADTLAADSATPSSGDGAGREGLSGRTQEHILGIGAAANTVTANLHSLQEWAHEAMRVCGTGYKPRRQSPGETQ